MIEIFRKGHKALIAYITVGYPDIETTLKVVPLLAEYGCDLIELGIPFSDPLADGVTIQKASYNALHNGVNVRQCFDVARQLCQRVKTPLVFMGYYNPILKYGLASFCNNCIKNGITGLIVPDLPPEEGNELEKYAREQNIDIIYLLAPNSTHERIKIVAERSRGFIYLVSVTGVTGARNQLTNGTDNFILRVRQETKQPLCVGFGISTPEQAVLAAKLADGVIIGSRIIQLMESDKSLNSVGIFVKQVRQTLEKSG